MGATTYSTAVDMWSVGCIFAELLLKEPLFQAKNELEMLSMIFKLLGPPTTNTWPGYFSLPLAKTIALPSPQPHQFRQKFPYLSTSGLDLLMALLTYDPEMRITAEDALQHSYFTYVAFPPPLLMLTRATENPRYPSTLICLARSHLPPQAKSTCGIFPMQTDVYRTT